MSDLASLFPDLPREVIQEFEQPGQSQGPLSVQGEVAQVTDDDVARYLQSRGALRAPLPPAVSGQQQPATPEFANHGRPAPDPSGAYVEAPDYGQQQQPAVQPPPPPAAPPLQPPQQFTQQQPLPSQTLPAQPTQPAQPQTPPPSPPIQQLPPSQTQPAPPPPPPGTPPVSQEAAAPPASPVVPSRADGIEALLGLWEGDPQLRSIVAQYLTTGQAPQVAAAAPPVTPQPPVVQPPQYLPPPATTGQAPPPALPSTQLPSQPQFDEYTDPQLRAMWERNQQLEAAVRRIAEQQQVQEQQSFRQNADHFSSIVEATASRFRDDYQLPPNVVEDVRKVAGRLGALNTYLNGTHPLTGLPVVPDPAEAVKTALEIAYYATPSAQGLERERIQQRAAYDAQHKQRLAGVGGSSASVPRQAPAPTDQAGRHSAMVSEVGQMMNGSWPGSN